MKGHTFDRQILQDEFHPSPTSCSPFKAVHRPPILRTSVFDRFHSSSHPYSPSLSYASSSFSYLPLENENWNAIANELKECKETELKSNVVVKHIDILNQFYPPLFIKPILGDGRCFYASVLDQMNAVTPSSPEVTQFKKEFYKWLHAWTVELMSDEKRLEMCHILFPTWVNETPDVIQHNLKEYIRIKSIDDLDSATYADNTGIVLMSTYIQRPILIYSYLVSEDFRVHFCIHSITPFVSQDPSFGYKNSRELWDKELSKRPLLLVHTHIHLQNRMVCEHYESLIPTPWSEVTEMVPLSDMVQLQTVYRHFPNGLCHIQPHMIQDPSRRLFTEYIRSFRSIRTCSNDHVVSLIRERAQFTPFTPTEMEETLRRVSWDVRSNNDVRLSSASVHKLWKPNSRLDDASIYAFLTMWSGEWGRQNPSIKHSLLIVHDTMFYQYISRSTVEEWEQMYTTYRDSAFASEGDVLQQQSSSIWGDNEDIRRAMDPPYKLLLKAQSKSPFPWTTSPFQYNQWILPIFLASSQHWVMLYVSLVDRIIFVFDPLRIEMRERETEEEMCWQIFWFMAVLFCRQLKQLSQAVPEWRTHQAYKNWGKQLEDRFNPDEWKFYQSRNANLVPFQDNQDDCGMFVLMYIETISKMLGNHPRPFVWDSNDIPRKRHEYTMRLLKKYSTNVVSPEGESSLSRAPSLSSLMDEVDSNSEAASYVDKEERMKRGEESVAAHGEGAEEEEGEEEEEEGKRIHFSQHNQVRQFVSNSRLKMNVDESSRKSSASPSKPSLKRSHDLILKHDLSEWETNEDDITSSNDFMDDTSGSEEEKEEDNAGDEEEDDDDRETVARKRQRQNYLSLDEED